MLFLEHYFFHNLGQSIICNHSSRSIMHLLPVKNRNEFFATDTKKNNVSIIIFYLFKFNESKTRKKTKIFSWRKQKNPIFFTDFFPYFQTDWSLDLDYCTNYTRPEKCQYNPDCLFCNNITTTNTKGCLHRAQKQVC